MKDLHYKKIQDSDTPEVIVLEDVDSFVFEPLQHNLF